MRMILEGANPASTINRDQYPREIPSICMRAVTGGIRGPVSGYGVHHPLTHAASENRRMRDVISPTLSPWFKPRSGHDEPWWPRCAKLQTGSISSACPSTPQQVGRYPHGKDMAASAPSGDRETKLEYQLFEPMKKEANVGNRHHCR